MNLSIKLETSSLLASVSNFLIEQDTKAYLVGGFVRDVMLGRETADIDIAVSADALEIAQRVAILLDGKYVLLDKVNKVGRVVLPSSGGPRQIDFSTLRGDIERDLAQRDFTIDALAVGLGKWGRLLKEAEFIDPFNGKNDLEQGVIHVVTGAAFESDPVRLLRAVRLAAELGFRIDKETEALIRSDSHLIGQVAGERVREELLRLLAVSQAGHFLGYLDSLGLLTAIIPEMAKAKGVEQPTVHFWDVFNHSIRVVVAVEFMLRQGAWEYVSEQVLDFVPWSAELSQHFAQVVNSGSTRGSLLKLAALLHDVAKPETKMTYENGRARFLGHATRGAEITASILERLRFSSREIKLVETLVRHHLRPGQMADGDLPSHRAIYRYFRDTEEAGIDILFLSLADHLATRGPNLDLREWKRHTEQVKYVLAQRFQEESRVIPPRLVDGHDLISIFGVKPGPEIGRLLEMVHEAQADGELTTREQALSFIRDCLLVKGCK